MTSKQSPKTEEVRLVWDAGNASFSHRQDYARTAPFIAGPLPLEWINRAATLPGKTLHVGLVLWFLAGICKSKTVRLGARQLENSGVSRKAKYEALRRLEEAGLISVDQQPGKFPTVTLLDAPELPIVKGG